MPLAARGIADDAVLEAFRSVPRDAFVPDELAELVYVDSAVDDRGRADDLAAVGDEVTSMCSSG